MAVAVREVSSSKERGIFIYLPEKIHAGHAAWLPPLYGDEKKYFDPARNPSFKTCDFRMLLAYKEGRPVGRILGIINRKYNEMLGVKNVRFGFLECTNDPEVSHALIAAVEEWGKKQGMTTCVGPFGFSDRDIQGLLIEGFEYEPVVDSATNFEFLPGLVTAEGYEKELDCVIYRYPLSKPLPEIYDRIFKRVVTKSPYKFLEFTSRKPLKDFIIPVLQLVNESFKDIYGFVPMDEEEMFDLAKRYLPILDPRFVKIITTPEGQVIAFMVAMPNMYRGIQKARGRLFPFGMFHILYAMRHAESVNTMLGAVHPDYQKRGLDIFLSLATINSAKKAGMKNVDTHVVMEENFAMAEEFKRFGADLIKKFRVYRKTLA
jgi:hypothetical protein